MPHCKTGSWATASRLGGSCFLWMQRTLHRCSQCPHTCKWIVTASVRIKRVLSWFLAALMYWQKPSRYLCLCTPLLACLITSTLPPCVVNLNAGTDFLG